MENVQTREPWNKGKLIGQKPPLKLKDIWAIRIDLRLGKHIRELAMFILAIDSKLRGCDLVNLRVRDVTRGKRDKFSLDMLVTRATRAGRHVELALSRLFSTAIPVTGLRANEYATLRKLRRVLLPVFFA